MTPFTLKQLEGLRNAPSQLTKRLVLTAIQALEKCEDHETEFKELQKSRCVLDVSPPSCIEAEMAVLGSILLLPTTIAEVSCVVAPDDFYDDANRKIYEQLLEMHRVDHPIDVVLLVEQLRKSGSYDSIGGAAYLAELGRSTPTASHATYYAGLVADKATLRRLMHAGLDIQNYALDPGADAKAARKWAADRIGTRL